MMEFIFFGADNAPLFVRSDAESAQWCHEEMTLTLEFPYLPDKKIQRGQRVGFRDVLGAWQVFEARKTESMEPDHYQRVTCEHIAIAELTDEHFAGASITDVTASAALTSLLTGTLWSVGNVTAAGTSSADLGMGSVWQNVRSIEKSWNVYITPRVTVGASGITGRYLDIAPAAGVWRGIRLSLNKNMDEIGVTWDDTNTLTAMYGYGRTTNGAPLNFSSVTWSATSAHPAKPSGQTYIEDTAATALYGRNGRARFGFYQNGDVTDAEKLLELTWEALKNARQPTVTIDCMICDMYRLGYADQPMRLHDLAIAEVLPIGETRQLEIIRLTENLLDPTATRATLGTYVPNIIYINRQTAIRAGGGRGGGSGNGRGQTTLEKTISEFETEIQANQYEINLRAYQRDMDNVDEILRQAGISINAQGVIVYADDNVNMLGSKFEVQAGQISSLVTKTGVNSLGQNETLYSEIVQNATDISTLVTKTGINSLGQSETLYSEIVQTATDISTLVTKTGINSLGQGETLYSEISQNAQAITTKVSAGDIASTINQTAQSVLIQANKIDLQGYVTASDLSATNAQITNLTSGQATATSIKSVALGCYSLTDINGQGMTILNWPVSWQSQVVVTNIDVTMPVAVLSGSHDFVWQYGSGQSTSTGRILLSYTDGSVSNYTSKTIYYLGAANGPA